MQGFVLRFLSDTALKHLLDKNFKCIVTDCLENQTAEKHNHRTAEVWRHFQRSSCPSPSVQGGSATACWKKPYSVRFWISPRPDTPQPLWV